MLRMKVVAGFVCVVAVMSCAGSASTVAIVSRTNSLGMRFVRVPGGSFSMGHKGELTSPIHRVSLDAFWMGCHEVTNLQYERYKKRRRGEYSPGDDEPVGELSRDEAEAFARWLSKKDGVRYALPTEAQWEYAARGGLEGKDYPWGDGSPWGLSLLGGLRCMPVGSFPANAYGLRDMAGNVSEFVRDAYGPYRDSPTVPRNPAGPSKGEFYLSRGGGVGTYESKVWQRFMEVPDIPNPSTGFRLVIEE